MAARVRRPAPEGGIRWTSTGSSRTATSDQFCSASRCHDDRLQARADVRWHLGVYLRRADVVDEGELAKRSLIRIVLVGIRDAQLWFPVERMRGAFEDLFLFG